MYDLCFRETILKNTVAIVVYRQSSPSVSRLERRYIASVQYGLAAQRGFFYCFSSICETRTKLAPYCQSHSSTCTGPSGTPKGHSWISLNPSYCLQRKPARSRIRKPRRLPNTVTISARRRKQSGIVSSFFWNPWPGMILSPFPAVALNL